MNLLSESVAAVLEWTEKLPPIRGKSSSINHLWKCYMGRAAARALHGAAGEQPKHRKNKTRFQLYVPYLVLCAWPTTSHRPKWTPITFKHSTTKNLLHWFLLLGISAWAANAKSMSSTPSLKSKIFFIKITVFRASFRVCFRSDEPVLYANLVNARWQGSFRTRRLPLLALIMEARGSRLAEACCSLMSSFTPKVSSRSGEGKREPKGDKKCLGEWGKYYR